MTKKIIATALVSALSFSASAATVTIGGDQEWSWKEQNGVSTTALDGDINVIASEDLANGMSVSADFNIDEVADDDGGASLTVSGAFGKLDLGDASGALDAIDDRAEWGYVLTSGSPSTDHPILWTLPSMVDNLTVHVSAAGDSNYGTTATAGTAYSLKYKAGPVAVGYGALSNNDDSKEKLMTLEAGFGGVNLDYEVHTDTDTSGVDTDTTTIAASYKLGDTTVAVNTLEEESAGTVSEDAITYGVHYKVGGGLTAFVEQTSDDITPTSDATVFGLAYKF